VGRGFLNTYPYGVGKRLLSRLAALLGSVTWGIILEEAALVHSYDSSAPLLLVPDTDVIARIDSLQVTVYLRSGRNM
jgi:hypothetical protein